MARSRGFEQEDCKGEREESSASIANVRGRSRSKVSRDMDLDKLSAKYWGSEKVSDKTPVPPPDWEALIAQIADEIMAEHTPARILQVRAKLYDLLSHCIPPTTILKVWHFDLYLLILHC